jgi:hypothetical protein
MFEYAISAGEGTLLDYGIVNLYKMADIMLQAALNRQTILIGPAYLGCQTGK